MSEKDGACCLSGGLEEIVSDLALLGVVGVGFLAGLYSGVLGAGGALVSTPGIRFLGATPAESVASTLPGVLPSVVTALRAYHRAGLVDWRFAVLAGSTGAVTSFASSFLVGIVTPNLLLGVTGGLLFLSGLKLGGKSRSPGDGQEVTEDPEVPSHTDDSGSATVTALATGALAGSVSALLGVGGTVVTAPVMLGALGWSAKRTVATGLACVPFFAVPAMVGHTLAGNINWSIGLALAAGSVPGGFLGARITLRANTKRLTPGISVLLVALGLALVVSAIV